MIIPKHYENPEVLHENTMPVRAYYIPSDKREKDLVEHREESSRFTLLNGQWDFKYYDSIHLLQESFYQGDLPDGFTSLPVPLFLSLPLFFLPALLSLRFPSFLPPAFFSFRFFLFSLPQISALPPFFSSFPRKPSFSYV